MFLGIHIYFQSRVLLEGDDSSQSVGKRKRNSIIIYSASSFSVHRTIYPLLHRKFPKLCGHNRKCIASHTNKVAIVERFFNIF